MPYLYKHLLLIPLFICAAVALWPEPAEFTLGSSVLWLSPDFQIVASGEDSSYTNHVSRLHRKYVVTFDSLHFLYSQLSNTRASKAQASGFGDFSEQDILQSAIRRSQQTITASRFVPWKFHSRSADWEPLPNNSVSYISHVRIDQKSYSSNGSFDAGVYLTDDESYTIDISTNGKAVITSNATIGSMRALQTLEQLFYLHSSGSMVYTPYAPVSISDYPRWAHRGLNLDISRSPLSPEDVTRTIDAMATAKMSRLHIHATDAQSWPIEVPSLPDLAVKGAYRPYLVWSTDDLAEVQLYGLYRGISVFIEIDMPGHTASIANAYPDMITAHNEADWSTFAAEPPSGQLKLNSSGVYDFLTTLFNDVLPRVSPYTTFFHNGGDEVNNQAFLLDEGVRSNSSQILQPLVQKLMSYVTGMVSSAGLTPIVWEEMLLDWNLTLPSAENSSTAGSSDTIIQVWRSSENLLLVLEKGYRALFGDYNHWYLDCGHGGFINPYPSGFSPPGIPFNTSGGVATQIHDPFVDYCSPLKNWRHVYVYDPLANITESLQYLIEGGEVHMWTEQTDAVNLDGRVWPRAASAAEVLWSGPRANGTIEAASLRLGEWRERVVIDHGVAAGVVQMVWCLMEGGCDL